MKPADERTVCPVRRKQKIQEKRILRPGKFLPGRSLLTGVSCMILQRITGTPVTGLRSYVREEEKTNTVRFKMSPGYRPCKGEGIRFQHHFEIALSIITTHSFTIAESSGTRL